MYNKPRINFLGFFINQNIYLAIDMKNIFNRANVFNCDLSKWKLNDNIVCNNMFTNSNIAVDNKSIKLLQEFNKYYLFVSSFL